MYLKGKVIHISLNKHLKRTITTLNKKTLMVKYNYKYFFENYYFFVIIVFIKMQSLNFFFEKICWIVLLL